MIMGLDVLIHFSNVFLIIDVHQWGDFIYSTPIVVLLHVCMLFHLGVSTTYHLYDGTLILVIIVVFSCCFAL